MKRSTNVVAVTAGVMLATFLAALDTTVVGTAMPTIIGTLGGLGLYSWVFSAYLLTSTTTVPVYGRLSDMYGRKPIFAIGAVLFLGGSALCGAASSMEQLIVFRAIQGLGAGAVLPVSMTVVGDIYPVQQRAQIQGLFSAVWGVSAILGPTVGGVIVDSISWRWVFYINIPFGIFSILLFYLFLHETVARRKHSIDYMGAVWLSVAISVLLLGLLELGEPALPVPPWSLIAVSLVMLVLFVRREMSASEPLLPLTLFRNRVVSVSNAANFVIGAVLIGLNSYLPPFVQGVMGGTAVNAGIALMPMSIGWPVGSTVSGRLILRFGYRPIVVIGTALVLVGSILTLFITQGTSLYFIMVTMTVIGLGMGFGATSFLVAVQSAVGWGERGIATASVQFFRTMGSTIGVALMGALMNATLAPGLAGIDRAHPGALGQGISGASLMLDPAARASLAPDILATLRTILASSLHYVYISVAVVAFAGFVLALLFPRGSVEEHAHQSPGSVPSTNGKGSSPVPETKIASKQD